MATLLVFRTQIKIWRNTIKRYLVDYPLMVLLIFLLMLGGAFFGWYGFITFKGNIDMLKSEILASETIIGDLVFNYLAINFLIILVISVLKKISLQKANPPEVFKICAYNESKIQNAFNFISSGLIYLLILLYITPFSFIIFKLTGISNLKIIILLILFNLYYLSMFYLANILFTISKYTLFKFSSIRNKDLFSTILGFKLIVILAGTAILFFSETFYNVLPTGLLYEYIVSLQANVVFPDLIYQFILNILVIASIIALSIILDRIFKIDSEDDFSKEALQIISFRHKFLSHYLVLIVIRTIRNFESLLVLFIFTVSYILLAFALNNFDFLSDYIFIFVQATPILFIAIIGFYILNFDDHNTQKTLFTYKNNIKEYNFLFITFYSVLFYVWFWMVTFTAFSILDMNDVWISLIKNQYGILMYILLAVLYKNLLISDNSGIFIRVITFYLYVMTIGVITILVSQINDTFGLSGIDWFNILMIILFSYILYYIQLFVLEAKRYQKYV